MANEKNFSESKASNSVKKCLFCRENIPRVALAFSNRKAISLGYCSFMCMVGLLGDKAYSKLSNKAKL